MQYGIRAQLHGAIARVLAPARANERGATVGHQAVRYAIALTPPHPSLSRHSVPAGGLETRPELM